MSGLEIMLRSMLPAGTLDQVKEIAESGALQRIVAFAEALPQMQAQLDRIEALIKGIEWDDGQDNSAKPGCAAEPGDGAGRYVIGSLTGDDRAGVSGPGASALGPFSSGAALADDNAHSEMAGTAPGSA